MKVKEAIEGIIKANKLTKTSIGNAEGLSPQTITNRLNRSASMSVENASQLFSGCGYKLVAVPRGEKVKDGWYEVTE